MAKFDVVQALQSDLDNPASFKSGEYLEDRILRSVRRALAAGNRDGVLDALREWLNLRQEPHTMLAVTAAKKEQLSELAPEIQALRTDVCAGRALQKFYLRWIDEALHAVEESKPLPTKQ